MARHGAANVDTDVYNIEWVVNDEEVHANRNVGL
jgi:hypothetical protein